jgi:hypothetical protein
VTDFIVSRFSRQLNPCREQIRIETKRCRAPAYQRRGDAIDGEIVSAAVSQYQNNVTAGRRLSVSVGF